MKKVRIIKIVLWTMLILFIGYILYLMYVEPYTKNGWTYVKFLDMDLCQVFRHIFMDKLLIRV